MTGRLMRALALGMTIAAWAWAPAHAAEPAQGTLRAAGDEAGWSGQIAPGGGVADIVYAETGGTQGTCGTPHCDTFRLHVGTAGEQLTVEVETVGFANNLGLEVVAPDGTTYYANSFEAIAVRRRIEVSDAPQGDYVVNVSGEPRTADVDGLEYAGFATLGAAAARPCPAGRTYTYEAGGDPVAGQPVDDPLFARQPGLQLLKAPVAWARGHRGKGATIAVVDTGVDLNHPDLRPNLVTAPGILKDADLVEGVNGDCAEGPQDDAGHGTHVAGIAAARGGNGIGIAGVAPEARILPVRVCTSTDCDLGTIPGGIRWAADRKADVINVSLGFHRHQTAGGAFADLVAEMAAAVAYAWEQGSVVVAGAGNGAGAALAYVGEPLCAHPAASAYVLCAAATDREGRPAQWSNLPNSTEGAIGFRAFGGQVTGMMSFAPALGACDDAVLSTFWPGGGGSACGFRGYAPLIGTSMASPAVAGAAAVLAGMGLDNEEIVARLKATSSNDGGSDPVMGYGIPDLDRATAP